MNAATSANVRAAIVVAWPRRVACRRFTQASSSRALSALKLSATGRACGGAMRLQIGGVVHLTVSEPRRPYGGSVNILLNTPRRLQRTTDCRRSCAGHTPAAHRASRPFLMMKMIPKIRFDPAHLRFGEQK